MTISIIGLAVVTFLGFVVVGLHLINALTEIEILTKNASYNFDKQREDYWNLHEKINRLNELVNELGYEWQEKSAGWVKK